MLSARTNRNESADDDDDDDNQGGESTMPGDYEPRSRTPARNVPRATGSLVRPSAPRSTARLNQRPTNAPVPKPWPPVTSDVSPVRRRRSKRRPITPDIVIEKSHHHRHHHHHSSSRRDRVIRIPLDNRPTLGLRGPPKRVLEIERVRCRRSRKRRLSCYEIEYEEPAPPLMPQSNIMFANPLSNQYIPPAQPSLMLPMTQHSTPWLTTFSNLTPEIIENLPRQTVHLPPIHLPGSHADGNTELDTVIFPAEIVNPIDGTLSIVQADPAINNSRHTLVQSPVVVPIPPSPPPPLINTPANAQSPLEMLASASGPFMQQVHDLFQRVVLAQSQLPSSPSDPPIIHPSALFLPQSNPTNIQPALVPHSGSYNATVATPYPPANITPYQPISNVQYNRANTATPYAPANITPYRPANIAPYTPLNSSPYRPANITPYQSTTSNFISSNPINNRPYPGMGLAAPPPAPSSDIGPYSPANITPVYVRLDDQSSGTYFSPPSLVASDSFNSSSNGLNNRPLSIPQSSAPTPHPSNIFIPKSIMRHSPSNRSSTATYTRFHPSSVFSANNIVREMVTAV